MRRASQKSFLSPESGSYRELKRFLLSEGWRRCTDCSLRQDRLELRVLKRVHWLCAECCKKLIHRRWNVYHEKAEAILLNLIQQAAPELRREVQETVIRLSCVDRR